METTDDILDFLNHLGVRGLLSSPRLFQNNKMIVLSLFNGMGCAPYSLRKSRIHVSKIYVSEIDKSANHINNINFPDSIQLGCIKELWKNRFTPGITDILRSVDILVGGSPCFATGTKVLTSTGYKNIEDVNIGDMVLTHKNRYRKVLKKGGDIKDTLLLSAQGMVDTVTTSEHPYYKRTMYRCGKKMERRWMAEEWTKVSGLAKDDFLAVPILNSSENPYNLTPDECWVLGRYIADGHIRNEPRSGRKNSSFYQLILSIGDSKINDIPVSLNYSLYPHTKSTHRCVFSSKRLVNLVKLFNLGRSSSEKNFSIELLNLPKELLKVVIDGYVAGDGSVRGNCTRATTTSKMLAISMPLAILKVYGTCSCVEYCKRPPTSVIEGRTVNQQDSYVVSFRKETNKQDNSKEIDGLMWSRFKRVSKTGRTELVYNIEVEEDNSYTANNFIVHNCQGFSQAGKQKNFDHPGSALFFHFVDILERVKELNPSVRFMLENVKMKKEWRDIISGFMGVEPVFINSSLVCAQSRQRWYWANWPIPQPEDRGIFLKDIVEDSVDQKYYLSDTAKARLIGRLEKGTRSNPKINPDKTGTISTKNNSGQLSLDSGTSLIAPDLPFGMVCYEGELRQVEKSTCIGANYWRGIDNKDQRTMILQRGHGFNKGGFHEDKSPPLTSSYAQNHTLITGVMQIARDANGKRPTQMQDRVYFIDGKSPALTAESHGRVNILQDLTLRRLTPVECERLQGLPDGYSGGVSDTQRYKMLGNGWQCDTIVHIFDHMPR